MSTSNDISGDEVEVKCSNLALLIRCRSRKDFDRIREVILAFNKSKEIQAGADQAHTVYIVRNEPPRWGWYEIICGTVAVLVATICAIGVGEMIYVISKGR